MVDLFSIPCPSVPIPDPPIRDHGLIFLSFSSPPKTEIMASSTEVGNSSEIESLLRLEEVLEKR